MPHSCPDCAGNPVNHTLTKFSVIIDWVAKPYNDFVFGLLDTTSRVLFGKQNDVLLARFLDAVTYTGIARWAHKPGLRDSGRAKCLWEAAQERSIKLKEWYLLGRPTELFVAEVDGKTLVFDMLPRPVGATTVHLDEMDDKGLMLQRFGHAHIPVPRGGVAVTRRRAEKLFKKFNPPIVVKPNFGSRSRHTTMHIKTEDDLLQAFRSSKELSPWVVVQEELIGTVVRATVIGGKVVAVLRRDPPLVVGDGQSTVWNLIRKANKDPKRQGPIFHHIHIGPEAKQELARQGLAFDSIPKKGQAVTLGEKVGRSSGGTNTDVTDITHRENIKLFERVAHVLRDPLVGIDCIMSDIAMPWHVQPRCGIIECNSMPFVDLHYHPFEGKPRNPANELWDLVIASIK